MEPVRHEGVFPDTRWSLILRLRASPTQDSTAQALNELCQVYWQPLYAYLRRLGQDSEKAKDSVQGFLAHFLSRNGFEQLQPTDGRFRNFLLASLRNYTVSEVRRETAIKRGGQADIVSLDIQEAEQIFQTQAGESLSPEASFDRQWAQTIWSRALARLRVEQRSRGREQIFEALKPALTEESQRSLPELAQATGMTPSSVTVAVHRMRRRLRELVIDELTETVAAHDDVDGELNYFLSIWSK